MTDKVIVRADGSTRLGHGHIFRTLTLAAELARRGWEVNYVCRDLEGAPLDRIRDAGFGLELLQPGMGETEDAEQTARFARRFGASWIVIDRYASDDNAHRHWREEGFKVLAIDDICEHPFPVDILLNQNAGAEGLVYETADDTIRLLGPRYALVREAYREARPSTPRAIQSVRRVMVFMGGTDPTDTTGAVLSAFDEVEDHVNMDIVVGSGYRHMDRLASAARNSHHLIEIHRDLTDLVGPMSRAEMAIAAGGSAIWELCCMGLPMVLVPSARNQIPGAREMARLGAASVADDLGIATAFNEWSRHPHRLKSAARIAYNLVDGHGAARVASKLLAHSLRLRTARISDARMLWLWANDPAVRAAAFTQSQIPWEAHLDWLRVQLSSTCSLILIATTLWGESVGQIRFNWCDIASAEVDVSVSSEFRGLKLGSRLIKLGCDRLFDDTEVAAVRALIKTNNRSSRFAFEAAGFEYRGTVAAGCHDAWELILERPDG